MNEKIHIFEKAGLGVAPFRFVGMHVERGPIRKIVNGFELTIGSDGQPMGVCEYCGQGIANCCDIESSDGKHFVVGTDCVMKTGDKGLRVEVDKIKTAARHEREKKIIADNLVWVDANRTALQGIQYGRHNLLESIEWYYRNAGNSGKLRIIKDAKKLLSATAQ